MQQRNGRTASPLQSVPNSYQPPANEPAYLKKFSGTKASGLLVDGHSATERLMTLLNVTSLPPLLTEEAAEAMLSIGAEAVVPNVPVTLAKFVDTYCHPDPFLTDASRNEWIAANAWCPVVNVPPVACAQPPATFASEAARAAWMAANPTCPAPPAFCPPPPSFRSAEERATWAAANPTCPVPAPFEAVDDHVCPADQPHCHDVVATPAPVAVPAKSGFWKGMAVMATIAGGAYLVHRRSMEEEKTLGRDNPRPRARKSMEAEGPGLSAKKIVPIAVGGAAIIGAVILLKPASAAATALPSPIPTPTPTRSSAPAHTAAPAPVSTAADQRIAQGEQFTTAAPGTLAAVVQRLNSTPSARPIFAFQALLFSYGATQYLPDGLMGPHTLAMIHSIDPSKNTVDRGLYAQANTLLSADHSLTKVIPSMPAATIHLVNAAIVAMAPGAPLLQVQPS